MTSITVVSPVRSSYVLKSAIFEKMPDHLRLGQINVLQPEQNVHRINQNDSNIDFFLQTDKDLTGLAVLTKAIVRKPSGLELEFMCTVTDLKTGTLMFNSGDIFDEEGQYIINSFIDFLDGRRLTGDPAFVQVSARQRLQYPSNQMGLSPQV